MLSCVSLRHYKMESINCLLRRRQWLYCDGTAAKLIQIELLVVFKCLQERLSFLILSHIYIHAHASHVL